MFKTGCYTFLGLSQSILYNRGKEKLRLNSVISWFVTCILFLCIFSHSCREVKWHWSFLSVWNIFLTNLMVVQLGHRHSKLFFCILNATLPVDVTLISKSQAQVRVYSFRIVRWSQSSGPSKSYSLSPPATCFLFLGSQFLINTTTILANCIRSLWGISTVSFLLCPTSKWLLRQAAFLSRVSHICCPPFHFTGPTLSQGGVVFCLFCQQYKLHSVPKWIILKIGTSCITLSLKTFLWCEVLKRKKKEENERRRWRRKRKRRKEEEVANGRK